MQIEVSLEELKLLRELVDREITNLSPEIHHTRTPNYRDGLKAHRDELQELRDHLTVGCG